MTALDLLLIVVFVISVIYGVRRGVILQLGAVGGIVIGIVACRVITPLLCEWLLHVDADADSQGAYVDTVIVNIVVFMVAYFGTRLVSRALNNAVRVLHLKPIDRICGAIFSLFEWMLGLSLLLNVANVIMPGAHIPERSKLSGGRAIEAVMDLAPDILGGITVSDLLDGDDTGSGDGDSYDDKNAPQPPQHDAANNHGAETVKHRRT